VGARVRESLERGLRPLDFGKESDEGKIKRMYPQGHPKKFAGPEPGRLILALEKVVTDPHRGVQGIIPLTLAGGKTSHLGMRCPWGCRA